MQLIVKIKEKNRCWRRLSPHCETSDKAQGV